jgi:ribosomal protein S7
MEYLKTKISRHRFSYGKNLATFIVLKLVKGIMRSGKFQKFYNILMRGTKNAVRKLKKQHKQHITPIELLLRIVIYLGPFCDVKALKASGRRVLVPAPFRIQKRVTVAVRFFIRGIYKSHSKYGFRLHRAITEELMLLYFNQTTSESFQQKKEFLINIFVNEKNLRFLRHM